MITLSAATLSLFCRMENSEAEIRYDESHVENKFEKQTEENWDEYIP